MDITIAYKDIVRWASLLEYYQSENAQLKNRLSEVAEAHLSTEKLSRAEYYQNEFLETDRLIHQLKAALRDEERRFQRKDGEVMTVSGEAASDLEAFRARIYSLGGDFNRLKEAFSRFAETVSQP